MHISSPVAAAPSFSSVETKVYSFSDPSDKRRFATPSLLPQLQAKLLSLFSSISKIQYFDEDEDLITLATQDDLDFVLAKLQTSGKCLRLVVFEASPVQAAPNALPCKLHSRFVEHVTCPLGTCLPPLTNFVKSWKFRNEGKLAWTPGSVELIYVSKLKGDLMGAPQSITIQQEVPVGGEIVLGVEMTSPSKSGRYQSHWRMRSVSLQKKFGQRVACEIEVKGGETNTAIATSSSSSSEEENKVNIPYSSLLVRLAEMGFDNEKKNVKLLRRFDGDLDKVVAKLVKRAEKMKAKGIKKERKEQRKHKH